MFVLSLAVHWRRIFLWLILQTVCKTNLLGLKLNEKSNKTHTVHSYDHVVTCVEPVLKLFCNPQWRNKLLDRHNFLGTNKKLRKKSYAMILFKLLSNLLAIGQLIKFGLASKQDLKVKNHLHCV